MKFRDYQFLGTTQSLCPQCLALVPAKIINRLGRVYLRKRCDVHGVREDFVCGDAAWFDRHVGSTPGKVPLEMAVDPRAAVLTIVGCAPNTNSTRASACWKSPPTATSNAPCVSPRARRGSST